MDEPGTNPNGTNGDLWEYQVTEITRQIEYAWFTEDTNLTTTPIKFAVPPFGSSLPLPPVTLLASSFESAAATSYAPGSAVEGWAVSNNPVLVVNVPALAATENNALSGTNVLALHQATLTRTLPTLAGTTYTLSFVSHGRPLANGPVGWWKGENNALDSSVFGNNGTPQGGAGYAGGEVGNAFNFNGVNGTVIVPDSSSLRVTNQLTTEAWINATVFSGDQLIISKLGPVGVYGNNGYEYGFSSGNLVGLMNSPGDPWPGSVVNAPVPVVAGTWYHVAWTYDHNMMALYFNGQLVASNVIGPKTISVEPSPVLISADDNFVDFFHGEIDEPTIYSNALSIVQIQDIYAAGGAGKLLVGQTTQQRASVNLAGVTNATFIAGDAWTTNYYTFTAPSNGTVVTFSSIDDGMLLDSIQLTQSATPNPLDYYLPEEPLSKVTGESSQGDWKLEVLDNRTGATNPTPNLVSWELSLVLDRVNAAAIPLTEAVTNTNTVPVGFISYYVVSVPPWATMATNILLNASGPVNLLYDAGEEPGNGGPDFTLLNNVTGGIATLTSASLPPLPPGEYYLGVQNTGAVPVTFSIAVNFDITTLTNALPLTNSPLAATTVPRYFQYDVSSNATAVAFELINPTGELNLVASRVPLPDEVTFAYETGVTAGDATILVASNSTPVALAPGRWYLGVFNHDAMPVSYTLEALELGPPTIIPLTNNQAYATNFSPGQALTTFFEFTITNNPTAALFELYQMNGNVDLALDEGIYPYAPPYFMESANAGTNGQQLVIRTNQLGTNINGNWFLAVPNETGSNVSFTIHAVEATNGLLISAVPLNVTATLPGLGAGTGPTLTWTSVTGEQYEIDYSPDLVHWTPLGVVIAGGQQTSFTDPTPITGIRFYRIVQLPLP